MAQVPRARSNSKYCCSSAARAIILSIPGPSAEPSNWGRGRLRSPRCSSMARAQVDAPGPDINSRRPPPKELLKGADAAQVPRARAVFPRSPDLYIEPSKVARMSSPGCSSAARAVFPRSLGLHNELSRDVHLRSPCCSSTARAQ